MPTTREASDWLTVSAGTVAAKLSSLALGGATIGPDKLAVTGNASISGTTITGTLIVSSTSVFGSTITVAASSTGVIKANAGDAANLFFYEAANTLAIRNSTSSQTLSWYDTQASATDYHRGALKTARATLSGVSGATVTATGIIPDGAVVIGVTTKVTTGLGVSNGTTGYTVGDGSDVDRWGAITGTASGTSSDNTNWTAGTIQAFTAASDIVVTATGGNFDGTGVIYVSVQYLIGQCD